MSQLFWAQRAPALLELFQSPKKSRLSWPNPSSSNLPCYRYMIKVWISGVFLKNCSFKVTVALDFQTLVFFLYKYGTLPPWALDLHHGIVLIWLRFRGDTVFLKSRPKSKLLHGMNLGPMGTVTYSWRKHQSSKISCYSPFKGIILH